MATIRIYNYIIIFLIIKTRANKFVRRPVYFINTVVILPEIYKIISINDYYEKFLYLSTDKNLLFKLNYLNHFNIYAHVINSTITQVLVKNNTENEI